MARFTVPHGSIYRLQIDPAETATLSLNCEGEFTIGGQSDLIDIARSAERVLGVGAPVA